jgi:hypothetical protein
MLIKLLDEEKERIKKKLEKFAVLLKDAGVTTFYIFLFFCSTYEDTCTCMYYFLEKMMTMPNLLRIFSVFFWHKKAN